MGIKVLSRSNTIWAKTFFCLFVFLKPSVHVMNSEVHVVFCTFFMTHICEKSELKISCKIQQTLLHHKHSIHVCVLLEYLTYWYMLNFCNTGKLKIKSDITSKIWRHMRFMILMVMHIYISLHFIHIHTVYWYITQNHIRKYPRTL